MIRIEHLAGSFTPVFIIDEAIAGIDIMHDVNIIVRVNDYNRVSDIIDRYSSRRLHAILIDSHNHDLSDLVSRSDSCHVPCYFNLKGLGDYNQALTKIMEYDRNVAFIFHGTNRCTDVRILSSLGFKAGIELSADDIPGEELIELAIYYFWGCVSHGDIIPFSEWERIYSNDRHHSPAVHLETGHIYCHVDKDLNVALSEGDQKKRRYIGSGSKFIQTLTGETLIEASARICQEHLINSTKCAVCPAFRICSGFFHSNGDIKPCREFMSEVLEGIEYKKGGGC